MAFKCLCGSDQYDLFNSLYVVCCNCREKHKIESIKKPPLGLTPKWIIDEHRLQEIHEAITRYKQAHKEIPSEWIQEYISLCNV